MAEKTEKTEKKQEKQVPKEKPKVNPKQAEMQNEILVRIYGYDIPGSRNLYSGLTRIKGISWTLSNAICLKLNFSRNKKISELSKDDIAKIQTFLDEIDVPDYMKNRRADVETGKTEHLYSTDLEVKKEFDIKKLKKIRSYKGIRHTMKLPVRGQRTRSHFRAKGKKRPGKKEVSVSKPKPEYDKKK